MTPLVLPDTDSPEFVDLYNEMLKNDLCLFMKDILGMEIGPHILAWGDLVAVTPRLCINAARGHAKSATFSYAYPIWRVWSDPGSEVYLFSATLDQAHEFLAVIIWGLNNLKGMVDIPALAHLVPDSAAMRRDPSLKMNKSDVKFTNGSRIRVAGYGKKMRGRHPKYIVLDDVLNDEDLFSKTVREKNISYFTSAITNMANRDSQVIVVGTPFSHADLYGFLQKNPVYRFCKFPGIIKDKNGKERALFPYKYTLAELKKRKREVGVIAFSREILMNPVSDDLSIFPHSLFPPLYAPHLTMRPTRAWLESQGMSVYMGVDIAFSATVGADFFVVFVIARDRQGNYMIVDIRRSKGLPFHKQLEEIAIAANLYNPALVFIESNQAQRVYTSEMRRQSDIPVKEFMTTAQNKNPIDKGIPSLRVLLEAGKIAIPRGDVYSRRMSDIWIEECSHFGFFQGKLQSAGTHDDTCLAWWLAQEAAKSGGFSFTFSDDGVEDPDDDISDFDFEKEVLGL